MEKRHNSLWGALGWWIVIVVFLFGGLAVLQYNFKFMGELPNPFKSKLAQISTPPMPEAKLEPPVKSPVLEKALGPADLIQKLEQQGIEIKIVDNSIFLDGNTARDFLEELYADEDAKKIFRQFGRAHIYIFLSNEYAIMNGYVRIRCKDGVKTTARWLATGKIK